MFEEIEISRQSWRGDCELQEGKLLGLLSGFRPRIQHQEKGFCTGGFGLLMNNISLAFTLSHSDQGEKQEGAGDRRPHIVTRLAGSLR